MYKCKHFILQELVSEDVYKRYGEQAWQFFDERLLRTIDIIWDIFEAPIYVNNWVWGGDAQQRGLRENTSQIVADKTEKGRLYVSGHVVGKAIDFTVKGLPAWSVRQKIKENKDKIPFTFRLEKEVTWVHIDLYWTEHQMFDVINKAA